MKLMESLRDLILNNDTQIQKAVEFGKGTNGKIIRKTIKVLTSYTEIGFHICGPFR